MPSAGVVHRNDEPVRPGQLCDQSVGQMRRERRDAALTGQMIPQGREPRDVFRTRHGVS
jgi:hypothetical protein